MNDTAIADVTPAQPALGDLTIAALTAIGEQYDRYLLFPNQESRDAVVLWVAHTHVFTAFDSTPRLSVRSSEPGSGKSRVLELADRMCPKVLSAVYLTPGVMWRTIEHGGATLLLDECDTIFGQSGSSSSHRELRAIINAGHRAGNTVPRCVGSEDVKQFNVFSPVGMAGIGRLPETIATRSVEIVMRKRKAGDREITPLRMKFAGDDLEIAFKAAERWGQRAMRALRHAQPDMPVKDRKADVWEPLVAIADMAGEDWGKRARKACVRLTTEAEAKPMSVGVRLLGDIRKVWDDGKPALTVRQLTDRLHTMPETQWVKGEFSSRDMARLLAAYDVRATTARISNKPERAYKRDEFTGAWTRYVPVEEVTS